MIGSSRPSTMALSMRTPAMGLHIFLIYCLSTESWWRGKRLCMCLYASHCWIHWPQLFLIHQVEFPSILNSFDLQYEYSWQWYPLQGTGLGIHSLFFLYESLIFLEQKCDVLFSKCESCWSLFLMSDGSECCLLQRARRAMKSNLLFCFENKKV